MKKKVISIIFIIFILFLFAACSKGVKTINILTDEISVYEAADKFNANHEHMKVFVDYYNSKNEKENIFRYIQKNKIINSDIIIGIKPPDLIIDPKKFSKITKFSKKIGKDEINNLYYPAVDFINDQKGYATLYNINFPVIIARNDSIPDEYINKEELSIEDFCNLASSVNILKPDKKLFESRLGFIPSISNLNEIDFYFLFDSSIVKNNNKLSFDTPETRKAFNLYYEYDDKYNFGSKETINYLSKFNNINKKYFLKQKIISFDFINLSNTALYSKKIYKIFLIKNLKYISTKNKIITISKKSINKKEVGMFIDYLYDDDTQITLTKNIMNKIDYYSFLYIPVKKGLIEKLKSDNIIFVEPNINLDDYINKLKYVYFINNKIQKKFFEKYNNIKELINKGVMNKKDLLSQLSKEINK